MCPFSSGHLLVEALLAAHYVSHQIQLQEGFGFPCACICACSDHDFVFLRGHLALFPPFPFLHFGLSRSYFFNHASILLPLLVFQLPVMNHS